MTSAGTPTPVVFVHGLWLHSTSWQNWVELFRENGYEPIAPEWPGGPATVAEARANPAAVANYGIAQVADHYVGIITALSAKPIVIGHSFGGAIAQNLLGRDVARAAVAIDPAPIKVASVALKNPANRKRSVSLTAEQFRYGFGNALPEAESAELFEQWTIPSPARPLFEAALANFNPNSPAKVNTANPTRGPLLLIAGGQDHTAPPAITKATLKLHQKSPAVTDYKEFPDRGHSLALDHGWREIADYVLNWLNPKR
jgi:non-heme chloroperoxidase